MMPWIRRSIMEDPPKLSKSYCSCYEDSRPPLAPGNPNACTCGEREQGYDAKEWHWETPTDEEASWVMMTEDQKQVTFHPFYSSGTAMVRGNRPFEVEHHYYWEVKMLTEPYGTDINHRHPWWSSNPDEPCLMIGLGTEKVDKTSSRFRFTSLLGQDSESYGFSYTGNVRHDDKVTRSGGGFCKGTIVGVKLDLWQGTIEFFINRESRGVSFFNLRRHPSKSLYPMICSTAAQSTMRLIYTGSWRASLLVAAAKILSSSAPPDLNLPPGLKATLKTNFWMVLPKSNAILVDQKNKKQIKCRERYECNYIYPNEIPITFNDYYTDNVAQNYRIAIVVNDVVHNMMEF